jgi:drug/metabolite transporter (DMT)-like permease
MQSIKVPAGLRYMIVAVFFFSLMSLMAKLVASTIPTGQIVFFRSGVGAILGYWWVRIVGIPLWGFNKKLLIFRGLTGFGALMCFFWTLITLPLAEATVLFYTSPCLAAVIAAILLREPLSIHTSTGLLACIVGVICVVQPEFIFSGTANEQHLPSVAVGLLGALLAALAFVSVRKLRRTDHASVIVFYFSFVSTFACIPFIAIDIAVPSLVDFLMLIGIGVATHIAQVFLTRSLHRVQTSKAMGISYVQVLFAAGWGILIFGDYPNVLSVAGMVLVAAGSITAVGGRQPPKHPGPPPNTHSP